MPYATAQSMIDAIGEARLRSILDIADSAEINEDDRLLSAIDEASSTIDAYLRPVYQLPIIGRDSMLEGICRDLARAILIENCRLDIITDDDREARNRAMDRLQKINSGAISLTWPRVNRSEITTLTESTPIGQYDRNRYISRSWRKEW